MATTISRAGRTLGLLLALIGSASWPPANAARTDDLLADFPMPGPDFERHIDEVRDYLLATQLDARQPADVDYNVPFELAAADDVPHRGRYLLIHGLNDSPAVWRDAAHALAGRGFDVRAILLPGHGNTPEAQLHVSWEQWLDVARLQLGHWRAEDVPMHLGGFSLGGVIATLLALESEATDPVDGMFLFAPAYYSTRAGLLRWASIVAPFKPWVFGGMITEDNPTKYNSIPINAAGQYYQISRHLQRRWDDRRLSMPVLMVETVDDSVVDVDVTRHIFATRFDSSQRRLVLYADDGTTPRDHETVRPSRYPALRILNQSHQGMMVSPDNPLFGVRGTQLVCNGNEWPVFSACLYYAKGPRWRGAEGTPSPDGVPVARTTYNPDFEGVMTLHDEVFATKARPQESTP